MTDKKETTTWGVLSKVDCSDHVEQKGGLTYLSWAWAWKILKENFPDASFEKHWFTYGDGYSIPYAMDKQGNAFVKVTVTVAGAAITEVMPVLDHRNRTAQKPDSFQVNTALQRCLTKAIGYHGLGHYIYAGEDLPDNLLEEVVVEDTPVKEDTPAPTPEISGSLDEWRKAFVDNDTVDQTDEGIVIAEGKNVEGWKHVVACFEVFMPSIDDVWGDGKTKYEDGDACVAAIEDFYLVNKNKAIKALGEAQPEMLQGLIEIFKAAKKAAKSNKPFTRKGVKTDG